MSYILDALNKSENERSKKKIPGLSALQDGEPTTAFGMKRLLMVLALLVILNSAGVYFYFGDRGPVTAPSPKELNATVSDTAVDKPQLEIEPQPTELNESPGAIPEVLITAHIYADDAELRMVKIDGVSRHEGDQIAVGHRLIEITEMGLVLEYYDERYELNVVEDWQSP